MINCRIVGLNQGMDFETNVSQTFLVLELPTGERVQAAVDDATATKIITLQVRTHGVPQVMARTPAPANILEEVETADGPAFVFGGQDSSPAAIDDAPEYDAPPEEMQEEDEPEEPPPPRQETPKQAKKRLRKNGSVPYRTVSKDPLGYPAVQSDADPERLTTQHNQDEDGVGSI